MDQSLKKTSANPDDWLDLEAGAYRLERCPRWKQYGKVVHMVGNLMEAEGIQAALGDLCRIQPVSGGPPVTAEVVGFQRRSVKLSPLSPLSGIQAGCLVEPQGRNHCVPVSRAMLGRVLNAFGEPIDGNGPVAPGSLYPLSGVSVNPLERPRINEQLNVGVRALNALLPIGHGQRMGIFAGSGVGKSTLLGMMARYTSAPVNVIALIGERGREVNEFIESDLGPQGMEHSVVVVATSDQPATVRVRGAILACTIAEYFRDLGQDVLLLMDSVTRFAMAQREIGLAAGEPPTTKGYTPSVFSQIPRLLERAGSFQEASITGIYTVLVEGDDMDDPIADTMRSILDGHIVLDRQLAQNRHYPPINVLRSVSRLTNQLFDNQRRQLASEFIRILAHYKHHEDMIQIGAYVRGSHPETDYAIDMIDRLNGFLKQPVEEGCATDKAAAMLKEVLGQ